MFVYSRSYSTGILVKRFSFLRANQFRMKKIYMLVFYGLSLLTILKVDDKRHKFLGATPHSCLALLPNAEQETHLANYTLYIWTTT